MVVSLFGKILPEAPDYPAPNAGFYPLHAGRISFYGFHNKCLGIVIHTPEEPVDDVESTPRFFAQDPKVNGSVGGTHYYSDSDGDIIQMCRDFQTPNAQGVRSSGSNPNVRLPRPELWDPSYISYNTMFLSIEVEGYASNIGGTLKVGSKQYKELVNWAAYKAKQYGFPADRKHILGHYELAKDRTDPGAGFPWTRFILDVNKVLDEGKPIDKQSTYVVMSGDTLGEIAGHLNVSVSALARVNNIANPNMIRIGQVLVIPGTEKEPVPAPDVPDGPVTTRQFTLDEKEQVAVHIVNGGMIPGNRSGIIDAYIEPTTEKSGSWEVHRLLVKRG